MIVSTVSTQTSFLSSCSDCTIKKMSYPSRPPFNIPNVRITKNNQFRNIFKPTIVKSIKRVWRTGRKMQPQSQSSFALNMLRCGKRDKSQKRQCYSFIHIIHYLLPIFSQIFAFKLLAYTGRSLNIVFFSKNSRKFATSPSPALGCYWLYKKLPSNRSDCTLALRWELWRSLTAM